MTAEKPYDIVSYSKLSTIGKIGNIIGSILGDSIFANILELSDNKGNKYIKLSVDYNKLKKSILSEDPSIELEIDLKSEYNIIIHKSEWENNPNGRVFRVEYNRDKLNEGNTVNKICGNKFVIKYNFELIKLPSVSLNDLQKCDYMKDKIIDKIGEGFTKLLLLIVKGSGLLSKGFEVGKKFITGILSSNKSSPNKISIPTSNTTNTLSPDKIKYSIKYKN